MDLTRNISIQELHKKVDKLITTTQEDFYKNYGFWADTEETIGHQRAYKFCFNKRAGAAFTFLFECIQGCALEFIGTFPWEIDDLQQQDLILKDIRFYPIDNKIMEDNNIYIKDNQPYILFRYNIDHSLVVNLNTFTLEPIPINYKKFYDIFEDTGWRLAIFKGPDKHLVTYKPMNREEKLNGTSLPVGMELIELDNFKQGSKEFGHTESMESFRSWHSTKIHENDVIN